MKEAMFQMEKKINQLSGEKEFCVSMVIGIAQAIQLPEVNRKILISEIQQ